MHDVGDAIPLRFEVVDPSTRSLVAAAATCTITDPDGVPSTPMVTTVETGRFSATFVPLAAGRYVERWVGVNSDTGVAIAARSDVINVVEGATSALISLAEAREHLNIPPGETVEDEELRGYITAATAAVEQHLGQVVARRSVTEYHDAPTPVCRLYLRRNPVLSVTSVATLDGVTTWAPANLELNAATGMLDTIDGDPLSGRLKVVYVAGYRSVPPNIILATQIIVAHLWQTQRISSVRQAPGFGGDDLGVPVGLGFALPNRALELLGGRPPVIA